MRPKNTVVTIPLKRVDIQEQGLLVVTMITKEQENLQANTINSQKKEKEKDKWTPMPTKDKPSGPTTPETCFQSNQANYED